MVFSLWRHPHLIPGFMIGPSVAALSPLRLLHDPDPWPCRVWDLSSGKCRGMIQGQMWAVSSVYASPDGKTCVSSLSDQVRCWTDLNDSKDLDLDQLQP